MNEIAAVREALDRMFEGELENLLGLLADDIVFQVGLGDEIELYREGGGKQAAASYFRSVSGLVDFWQMDYTIRGDQLIAWGRESYTVQPCGLEASNEFALVFDLDGGRISRLLIIEDLPAFFRDGRSLGAVSSPAREFSPVTVFDLVEHLAVSGVPQVPDFAAT